MKETMDFLKQQFIEAKDVAKMQWKSFAIALSLVVLIYAMSLFVAPGWLTYSLTAIPTFICAITALARVNDIGPERMGRRWEFRKISLVMVGFGCVTVLAMPFAENPMFPTWRGVVTMWGFAGAWMTTPGMPPWDYYITGAYRFLSHKPDDPSGPRTPLKRVLTRITGELSTDELLKAQKEWEAQQDQKKRGNFKRRGDGDGP